MKIKAPFSSHYFFKHILYLGFALTTIIAAKHDAPKKEVAAATAVTDIETYADYKKMMGNPEPAIVMVHATWCGACKGFKPTFEKTAEKYQKNAHFYRLNESVKELEKEIAELGIQGFPTILYIKKDLGGAPETVFDAKIRDFLAIPEPKSAAPAKKEASKKEPAKSAVKHIKTRKEYDAMMKSKKPAALLLHAEWCSACEMFKPTFHEVANKHNDTMNFYMLDVDTAELNKEISSFNIQGIPTTVFFKKQGKKFVEHSKMVGARQPQQFEASITEVVAAKKTNKKQDTKKSK